MLSSFNNCSTSMPTISLPLVPILLLLDCFFCVNQHRHSFRDQPNVPVSYILMLAASSNCRAQKKYLDRYGRVAFHLHIICKVVKASTVPFYPIFSPRQLYGAANGPSIRVEHPQKQPRTAIEDNRATI